MMFDILIIICKMMFNISIIISWGYWTFLSSLFDITKVLNINPGKKCLIENDAWNINFTLWYLKNDKNQFLKYVFRVVKKWCRLRSSHIKILLFITISSKLETCVSVGSKTLNCWDVWTHKYQNNLMKYRTFFTVFNNTGESHVQFIHV